MATLKPKVTRPGVAAAAAADRLSDFLGKEGHLLGERVHRLLTAQVAAGTLTEESAKKIIGNEIFASAGGTTTERMWDLILATVSTPANQAISLADPRYEMLWGESKRLAQRVIATGSTEPARAGAGPVLTEYVGHQVDDTQQKYSKGGRFQKRWVRHLNAGACSWCVEQKTVYDDGGPWRRHANCRCYKIPARW